MKNKAVVFILLIVLATIDLNSQKEILTFTEQSPEFIGGDDALKFFLSQNYIYPKKEKKIGTIMSEVLIDELGMVSNIKILKGVSKKCDIEMERVLGLMPRWKPGIQGEKKIRAKVSISFEVKPQMKAGIVSQGVADELDANNDNILPPPPPDGTIEAIGVLEEVKESTETYNDRYNGQIEYVNGKAVLLHNNKRVFERDFDEITQIKKTENYYIRNGERFAFYNIKKGFISPFKYLSISPDWNNAEYITTSIKSNVNEYTRYQGVLRANDLLEVLPMEYNHVSFFTLGNKKLVKLEKNNKFGVFDLELNRQIIPIQYSDININHNKLFCYSLLENSTYIFDENLKLIVKSKEFTYSYLTSGVYISRDNTTYRSGIINTKGQVIHPYTISESLSQPDDSIYVFLDTANQYSYINNGIITKLNYKTSLIRTNDNIYLILSNHKQSKLTTFNKYKDLVDVSPFKYEAIEAFNHNLIVKKNNKQGIIDFKDSLLCPIMYDSISRITIGWGQNTKCMVKNRGKWGLFNLSNYKEATGIVYDKLSETGNMIKFELNKKVGLMDRECKIVLNPEFSEIEEISASYILTQKDNKYGIVFIDEPNREVLPNNYDSITFKRSQVKNNIYNVTAKTGSEIEYYELRTY